MNILLLAPQPFYQVRGTPIAIDLLVSTLSNQGHHIDLVTYHEGEPREYNRVSHIRTPRYKILDGVQPGFSIKKMACTGLMFFTALKLVRKNKYDLVHANEEAVFIAYLFKKLFKQAYVYDMDSSLATQLVDKMPWLAKLRWPFAKMEILAIRNSIGVLAVCEALCKIARPYNKNVKLLTDVAMLDRLQAGSDINQLDQENNLTGTKLMYIGNLESYQGIDLMIEAFAAASQATPNLHLIIIGGTPDSIADYTEKCRDLSIADSVIFAGPKPFSDIEAYMEQADILISPRTKGENTPMKIYNYMASGKAIIATNIYSHTQVLDDSTAMLVENEVSAMASAITELADSETRRTALGKACRAHANKYYSVESFESNVADFFQHIESIL